MNRLYFNEHSDRDSLMFCRPIFTGDGRVDVRPIKPGDGDQIQSFMVGGLSATSRYFRFFQTLACLPPPMLQRFVRIDRTSELALVGITVVRGEECIVGEVRCALNADGESADIAIAIADAWQRRGVGRGLFGTLERIATATGIARFTGESLAVNDTFRCFAHAVGFKVMPDTTDRTFLRIEKAIASRRA